MLAMRLEHEAGAEDVDGVRARMAELALRYPGSLREIDELPLDEIRARIDSIDAAMQGREACADWMKAVGLFHALMRGALCAKRWLAGRKDVDPAVELGFVRAMADMTFPEEARAWQGQLARIASPPDGRVSSLVFERIAEHFGTSEASARRLVFAFAVSRDRPPRCR
jgi:hypothetical protein